MHKSFALAVHLYRSFLDDSEREKLPVYSTRNSVTRKDKDASTSFRVAAVEARGFSDHTPAQKKDFNNYYFSPLTMTDDEVFEAAVNMLMLQVNEDVFTASKPVVIHQVADFVR